MARPQKEGLDYFPLDVILDDKLKLIIAEFGLEGLGIIVALLQKIYENGYYYCWNGDALLLYSLHNNTEKTRVNSVITRSIERGIFNKELFDKYSILTSNGIQKRYLKVCKDCRRKHISIIREYLLCQNDELTKVITELTSINPELSTQRKEKESKEKKSKEDESKEETSAATEPITFKDVVNEFNKNIHPITAMEGQKFKEWTNDLDCEVIIKAIEEAVFNNVRTINYINAILNSWHSKGIRDIQGVEAYLRDRSDKKRGDNHNGNDRDDGKQRDFGF